MIIAGASAREILKRHQQFHQAELCKNKLNMVKMIYKQNNEGEPRIIKFPCHPSHFAPSWKSQSTGK